MDSDGHITIRIGASLDRSIEATFGALENRATRAGKNVANALGGGTGAAAGGGGGMRAAAREADRAGKEIEATFARQVKAAEKASREEYKAFEKAGRERVKLAAQIAREQDRFLRQETRNAEREAENRAKTEERIAARSMAARQRFASRTSQRSVRFLFPNPIGAFGMASRIGGDILRGAGVDFSMAGMAHRAVEAQALAVQLSNQGFMPQEKGANSRRVSGTVIEDEARKTAQAQGFTTEQMLRSQTKFVDLTGSLDDARKAMPQIAALSGATQTDPEKMAEAWANVSRHMGDIPNKAAKVEGLMRMIAGQGKIGSIEIKDVAAHLGRIAAAADRFGGTDKAGTIGKLTTMAQLSRAEGGSSSPAEAATAVARFVDTFQARARIKKFEALGINPYIDKNHTQLADPFETIRQSLIKTKGDALKMGDLWKSVMSQRAITALTTAFNAAGGGKAGIGAVDKKLAEFGTEATISSEQVEQNNKERMGTAAAQAVVFQEKLDEVGRSVEAQLLPALNELSPLVLQAAGYFGKIVSLAVNNPGEAIGIAITAAIARAGLESAFRAGIEKMVMGAMGAGPIAIPALAVTAALATITIAAIEHDVGEREKKQRAEALANGNAGVLEGDAMQNARKGMYTDKGKQDLTEIDANLERRVKRAESIGQLDKASGGAPTGLKLAIETLVSPERGAARLDAQHIGELKAELERNKHVLDMIRTGVLKVQVMNPTPAAGSGPPTVSPAGRGPAPG